MNISDVWGNAMMLHQSIGMTLGICGCLVVLSQMGCGSEDTVPGDVAPGCDTDSWIGNPDYKFDEHNYNCESDPIGGHFLLDAKSFVDNGNGITAESDAELDLTISKDLWNAVGAAVEVRHESADTVSPGVVLSTDSENHIFMSDGAGNSGVSFASAYPFEDVDNPGQTTNCDIEVYSKIAWTEGGVLGPTPWALGNTPESDEYALVYVLSHELGHCLGFAHNSISDSIMFSTMKRGTVATLNADDEEALKFLYDK